MKIHIQEFETVVGTLLLGSYNNALCLCDWKYRKQRTAIDERIRKALSADFIKDTSPIIDETKFQLNEYFKGTRTQFDISLLTLGTEFQKKVWNQLLQIPYGKTVSYRQLSEKMLNPKAIRAIASANGANAISILIPCHRIIGSDGSLIGYAGGLKAKEELLKIEGVIRSNQLSFF